MARNRMKVLGAGLGVLGMITTLAGVAGADDFTTDAPATVIQTSTVKVWVVATVDEVNGDIDHGACNIGSGQNKPFVEAAITSSDPSVATVDPGSMTFSGCDNPATSTIEYGQDLTITLIQDLCLTKTATISIVESDRGPGNSVKGVFNQETINVSVAPSNPLDPTCGGGGGGGGSTLCSEPAAPAWAAALLKASNLKPKQAKEISNYISRVAGHMTQGAVFDGIAKSDGEYPTAVRSYMMSTFGLSLASVDAAAAIRPGWACSPV